MSENRQPFTKDAAMAADLQRLRQRDNVTNVFYLAASWLYIVLAFAGILWVLLAVERSGAHWAWQIPILIGGVILVGIGQHHLGVLGHEGSHFSLFRNRYWNEIAADVFCMFPLFSTTQTYRRQHLAHHRHVNDPVLDPDLFQLEYSGHRFDFPKSRREVAWLFLKQLWPVSQVRYTLGRMRYERTQAKKLRLTTGERVSHGRIPLLLNVVFLVGMIVLLNVVGPTGDRPFLALTSTGYLLATSLVMLAIPKRLYPPQEQPSPVPWPVKAALRLAVWQSLMLAIAWTAQFCGPSVVHWMEILWIAPLFTSFSLCMMLRQVLHHANADSGFMTNSRNFFVNPLVKIAVFPLGQDLHLVHHMFSSVPHYNLKPLHDAMLRYDEYKNQSVTVEGIWSRHAHAHPSAVDVLGPEFGTAGGDEIFVDYEVDAAGREPGAAVTVGARETPAEELAEASEPARAALAEESVRA